MAKPSTIKVLEHSKISPSPNSSPSTTLPLTFFDLPWLFFSPCQPLFFYAYPHSTSHFLSSTLPNLKHSLSLALQEFFPFLGNLVVSSFDSNKKPKFVYREGDFVSFTVQESSGDFSFFTSNHARDVHEFYPLVPELATSSVAASGLQALIPLLAVKITIFSNMGICVGLAYHHVAADGRTFNYFINSWASSCANSSFLMNSLPCFDRSVIKDSLGLEEIFLKELWNRKSSQELAIGTEAHVDLLSMVRATFIVSLLDMERIKKWIIGNCKKRSRPLPIHLSPYVLTCSFLWVCLVKAQVQMDQEENEEDLNYFAFVAGGLTRIDYPVPATYFGNCVGFGRAKAIRSELLGEDGIIVAANVIGNMIRKLDKEIFSEAEKWISDWEVLFGSEVHVMVSGSPKLKLYSVDFGWGSPKKIEDISIDKNRAISLTESRDVKGGIEIGLALRKSQMEIFGSHFNEGLRIL
ncbi:malonyl-coenzyme A:anthocyanin 3-O-glucoside-6''-O-malonyltransferase [Ricinus communis]|uniref:Anthocyanin 5-aromatic acyltransferase, putative n=1 Tax=Ricinus communis TaxID=3988 RepID=B9RHE8_RICCO|nr:malonyl-coenzyme A:anthocyanin 3-O-glucoside-6''-O-malonyltransferase [Ricinus communis]EEF49158.1 Anthocyanin 5-aromatic acyltransferase, putative [Ricinus communis]|eukprot:XP_002513167.1 malonyl-coenzyme A:anthocyanin 3-O-glucoside-6''-O-malonyltransferase [Ricinus communis]